MNNLKLFHFSLVVLIVLFVFTYNIQHAKAYCDISSIIAGTCGWNPGTPTPPPTYPPNSFGVPGGGSCGGFIFNLIPNQWVDTQSQYIQHSCGIGSYSGFWSILAGMMYKQPDGYQTNVPGVGTIFNCMVGLMNNNGCPSQMYLYGNTISVSKSGSGTGTVSGGAVYGSYAGHISGGAINCGNACSSVVASNWPVTLTASSNASSVFAGWGGACSGTSPTCTFTVNANASVSAIFNLPSPPTNLVATMGSSPNIGKVNLTWTDNSTGETGFQIERSTDASGSTWGTFSLLSTTAANTTAYTDDLSLTALNFYNEEYRVRGAFIDGTFSDYSNVASTSNCVAISGNGPRKIVFERGSGWNASLSDYVTQVNNIVGAFQSTDPFKTYVNSFSFYVDLHAVDESDFSKDSQFFKKGVDNEIAKGSTCGSGATEYIFLFHDPTVYFGYTSLDNYLSDRFIGNVVYLDVPALINGGKDVPTVVMHESGHAIGKLDDEYIIAKSGIKPGEPFDSYQLLDTNQGPLENCVNDPFSAYEGLSNKIYGSTNTSGCGYAATPQGSIYYRPSANSIMNEDAWSTKFNVISCGYLVSAILGEPIDKSYAQAHWPAIDTSGNYNVPKDASGNPIGCMAMDTVKPDVTSGTTVITVGGGFTGPNNPIFNWVDSILPSGKTTIRIPGGTPPSIARGVVTLESDINDQLEQGNRVLVIGHSVGSIVAYSVQSLYQNPCYQSIYVDPPYNTFFSKIPVLNLLPSFSNIHQASTQGIASDPNSVIWTNGKPFIGANYLTHNPWSSLVGQNNPKNSANIRSLAQKINASLTNLASSDCSSINTSTLPSDDLDPAPVLDSILTTSGNGIAKPGDTITINGSNLSLDDKIRVEDNSDPDDIYYEIYDQNPDVGDNSISFTLPDSPEIESNAASGQYSVEVSGLNSDWSNILPITIQLKTAPIITGISANIVPTGSSLAVSAGISNQGLFPTTGNIFDEVSYYLSGFAKRLVAAVAGASSSIAGSGFTPNNNMVEFTANTSGNMFYASEIPSSNGTSINFIVPSDMAVGTYSMKVRSSNSDWSASVPITITAGPTPTPNPTPSTSPSPSASPTLPPATAPKAPVKTSASNSSVVVPVVTTTPSPSPSVSPSSSPSPNTTATPSPTVTPKPSSTPSPTATPTPTLTPASTPKPTSTPTPAASTLNLTSAIWDAISAIGRFFGGH